MAVVGKEHIRINYEHYQFKIRVLKDGLFRTEIPKELVDFAEDYRRRHTTIEYECETKEELLSRLKKLRDSVEASKTITRKVILYNIDVSRCVVEGPARLREDYDPERFDHPEQVVVILSPRAAYHASGMQIKISADVFIESEITKLDGTKAYSYRSNDVPRDERLPTGLSGVNISWGSSSKRATNLLEWTQDRHDFFVKIYEAMGKLAWQLHQLDKKDKLLKAIESGVKFLEGPGADKEET